MSKHSKEAVTTTPAGVDANPANTPTLLDDSAYIDWTNSARHTGNAITLADAERIIAESAAWEVPPLRGREWAQRVAGEAIGRSEI